MKKFTFNIYETWKIEKTFEAETEEEAWELATEHANHFELDLNDDHSEFVSNRVDFIGDDMDFTGI